MKLPTLCALLLAACASHTPPPSAADFLPVVKLQPTARPTPKMIELTAVVTSRTSRVIAAESDGAVMTLQAHNDQYVHLGDPIAQLDVSELRAKLAEYQGQLVNARGQAARAGAQYAAAARKARIERRLASTGASAPESVRAAMYDAQAAGAEGAGAAGTIKQAESQIAETNRLIAAANIKSPMDGTISVIKVRPGEVARKGTPIARVFDPTDPIVKFALPHALRGALKPGDTVQMVVHDDAVSAVVTTITDDHDPAIDFFTVVAELDKNSPRPAEIKVGATGHVRIADKGAVR